MNLQLLYYLVMFYLFAASGTLAYLFSRAWFDPTVAGRSVSAAWLTGRWANLARSIGFAAISVAAFIGVVYQVTDTVGTFAWLQVLRIAGYVLVIGLLPRDLRTSRLVIVGGICAVLGEVVLSRGGLHHLLLGRMHLVVGKLLVDIAVTLFGFAFKGKLFRLRLVDRLVIAFAISSMLLSMMVGALFLVLVINIGFESIEQVNMLVANAERPMIITLSTVLITSALIGFFLARDLSAPMTRLERALKAIGEGELDYRVQLRGTGDDEMHDLAREVNRMAQKLKSAESVRAEFFSFVSHELRSPLTAIRGFVETLQAQPDFTDEDRREIYDIIHEESDRLLRMIGELLDISRIQAGHPLVVSKLRFEVGRHVERVAEIMRGHTQRHALKVLRSREPVWMEADPDKLDQILINLVSNAIKYSPDGGDVIISLSETPDAIVLSVKDSGVGMTAAQSSHIFEKFYRVSEEDSPVGDRLARVEGAGIGLYLTRARVEAHGGRIQVESVAGSGSTFTVTLPRVVSLSAVNDENESEVSAATSQERSRSTCAARPKCPSDLLRQLFPRLLTELKFQVNRQKLRQTHHANTITPRCNCG